MSSTNQGPEYFIAEKKYLRAKTTEEQIFWLTEMIRNFKKHKGSETMLANLKQRLKRFREKQEKSKKVGKSTAKAIRKEGFQVVLLGLSNSGKSTLLAKLTNAHPKISQNPFTTKEPELGTMDYQSVKAQIVDLPSIGSEFFDMGIVNTADLIIIVLDKLEDLDKVKPYISKIYGKLIIVINKTDLLLDSELRKLEEKIKSKRINAVILSSLTGYGLDKLKESIFKEMNVIRVYMKEPSKLASNIPAVLPFNSSVKDAAESIRNGFSLQVKETRITGPSSKFSNQKVGLSHVLKDRDIIEFHIK